MYELYPYFTNDGTVGLFSQQDDDIYHSTYGAVTESWQKFILPAHFEEYLESHQEVKVLDICYGIGYNTKTALTAFINNFYKQKKILKTKKTKSKNSKNIKNSNCQSSALAAIGSDNISSEKSFDSEQKNIKFCNNEQLSNAAIDADNISSNNSACDYASDKFSENNLSGNLSDDVCCSKISIDAVDLDKTLISLSPFIKNASIINFMFDRDLKSSAANKIKYKQIISMKTKGSSKRFLKKEFRIRKEVSVILLDKMFKQNREFFKDPILQILLSNKMYRPFIAQNMKELALFYSNNGYKYNPILNLKAFLHNIYYRYVSPRYKMAKKLLKTCSINLGFFQDDARNFIKASHSSYNFIFLDAFTPAKCPALWTVQFFRELHTKLEDDGMILTYSNSAAIRNAFLQNGFFVGKIFDSETKKFVGTVAVKDKNLIEHELDELDIDLIHSKAGICFEDETLNADNKHIIQRREEFASNSNLVSSSSVMKGYKDGQK